MYSSLKKYYADRGALDLPLIPKSLNWLLARFPFWATLWRRRAFALIPNALREFEIFLHQKTFGESPDLWGWLIFTGSLSRILRRLLLLSTRYVGAGPIFFGGRNSCSRAEEGYCSAASITYGRFFAKFYSPDRRECCGGGRSTLPKNTRQCDYPSPMPRGR
jgi:hypothetical protein